ncbi:MULTISPECIES: MHYT domain-containing protein [Rhodomicrobium]|uniref:MHYT domain-containing protein n=1 Tax=Rhodomicrobium TaxID=1068 RepID=UPI000B4BFDEC|nr:MULTISPECIES: MHYT domain-containing protein [Rhodomicrobium]
MLRVYSCFATQHDWRLIILAVAICFFTSCAALHLFQRASATRQAIRALWLITIGAAAGYGVWATHFIAMLAYSAGTPVGYDLTLTLVSLLAAIVLTGVAFAVATESRGVWAAILGGIIFGLAVGVMHYMGMSAMEVPGHVTWSDSLVAASLAMGVLLGIAAMLAATRGGGGVRATLVSALLLTLSVLSLHFTGMAALEIIPDPEVAIAPLSLSPNALSMTIASAAVAVLGISLVAALAGDARQRLIAAANAELARQTEREAAETLVRERELELTRRSAKTAEQRLATAIEAMSEGFAIYDQDDRLVVANQAQRDLHGDAADVIVPGTRFEDVLRALVGRGSVDLDGADPEAWIADQLRARAKGDGADTFVHFSDGRWMLRRERRTPEGEMVGIRSDITSFKRHEQELSEAREKAEAADRAKSDFVAMISHEIRTPIGGIIGFMQIMLGDELSARQRERAEIIQTSADHLLHLANNLLDLSKISSDNVELAIGPCNLPELVSATVLSMEPLAHAKKLHLSSRSDLPPDIALICDSGAVRQILINLIGNAIKFTAQGSVTVSLSEKDDGFLFEVGDSGEGIPENKRALIFDRFAQLGSNEDRSQGTGLGLTITKRLVEMMKGRISVASEVGSGSVFSVWLPLPRRATPDEQACRAAASAGAQTQAGPSFDVLVAEDHLFNQMLIAEVLEGMGCQVTMTENGKQALDRLAAADFDLIIMDNQMPVMSGIDAIELIRARTDWKGHIPIIALTANTMRGTEKAYKAMGVNEFIAKPFDVAHVTASVKRLGELGRQMRKEALSAAA